MTVARYFDEEKAEGQFFPGVPQRDLTEEEVDALPEWLRKSIDDSPMYRKTRPKGWKAPEEPEPEPTSEPIPAPEGEEE